MIGPFSRKYATFDLKSTEESYFMTLKSQKFEEKLACSLENDIKNSPKFHRNT